MVGHTTSWSVTTDEPYKKRETARRAARKTVFVCTVNALRS
jgi:hypothetical protein